MSVRYGDIGIPLGIEVRRANGDIESDMGSATNLKVRFKKPSGTFVEKVGALSGDGSNGIVRYITVSGFLNEVGRWGVQVYFELGSFRGNTEQRGFTVEEVLA